ncbi:GNAT family N-acetyltransferase [Brevibacillus reuszeri]|uniref:GNAT family N-acetyltransferase n=1 Tax=Brevibacillus reuszeri TaxID=54915 RepID=UPI003D24449E
MRAPYRIAKLTKSDKHLFVSLMSKSFAGDPLFLHVFGDFEQDKKARSSVTAFVSFLFDKSFMLNEEVWGYYEKENLLGAYIVEQPQAGKLQMMVGGLLLIGRLIPLFFQLPRKALNLLNSYMRVTRSFAPPITHYYLVMIGVKQEAQRKGIGKTLLHHLMHTVQLDKTSHGIALDTENEDNVNLYRRFGFALNVETRVGDVPVYCMFYQKSSSGIGDC